MIEFNAPVYRVGDPAHPFNEDAPIIRTIAVQFDNAVIEITMDMLKIINEPDRYNRIVVNRKLA